MATAQTSTETTPPRKYRFKQPVRLTSEGDPIRVAGKGYAAPAMHDMNGDGIRDLLVGQYTDGKISIYPGLGMGKFGERQRLKVNGFDAKIPGVW